MKTLTILFLSLLSFNQVFAQQNEEDKQPVTLEITKTGITCFGSADATVTITIFGGFAPYAVNGTPINGNVFTTSGLAAGNYEFFISDIYMSNATAFVTFDEPVEIVVTGEITNASNNLASDGSITIDGDDNYTYQWSGPADANLNTFSKNQADLPHGAYFLTVSNASGCTVEYNFDVEFNTALGNVFDPFNPTSIENDFVGAEPAMILFYPNPAKDNVNIKKIADGEQLMIYNAHGILIKDFRSTNAIETIDLPTGVYRVVKVKNDGSVRQEQLIMN
jgi:hypothetical protein